MLMLIMWWPLLALLFSGCGALIVGFNQRYQLDPQVLVSGRLLGVLPLAGLAAWWLPWPHALGFYLVASGMGLLLGVSDTWLYAAAAKHGGRLAALYVPLKSLLSLLVWQALVWGGLVPATGADLISWRGSLLVLCVLASGWSVLKLRRNDASAAALLAVVPIALLLTLGDVVAKLYLPLASGSLRGLLGAVTAYLLVSVLAGAVGVTATGFWGGPRHKVVDLVPAGLSQAWRPWLLAAGFGAFLYLSITLLLVTLVLAPNPGLVTVISMLSGIWLMLYAHWRGQKGGEHWGAAVGLFVSAMAVAFLAR